jgi:serine/threonine protein kinase/WD40 repeat protein
MSDSFEREVAVFNAARRLVDKQRAEYLEESCAGDTELRRRVEELLRAGVEAGSFLQQPAPGAQRPAELAASAGPLPQPALAEEKPGEHIGRYKLLQQIGEGGCGVVYMAEQEEPVRRRVALKIIKLGMDTKQVIARFEAERQALALMDHQNIAKVLDAGATDNGRPYFVMELVRGLKITEYCDERNLTTRERLQVFIQVCQAIQDAHQKGIIHRDIKPSNILVTVNDGVAVPKVIDFGIAKATQGRLTDQTLFTAFEQFIGTPAYMSPEQADLTSLDIDTRSDIYSLGVLLYELLTGRTPFDQKELLASGLDAMRQTIRDREPPRPSTRLSNMHQGELTTTSKRRQTEPVKLIHLVRGDLDWIVMKCLEKDRARRYETANALVFEIQRHLNNEPVLAQPPSRLYRIRKMVQRNKGAFAAGVGIAAALLAGLVVSVGLLVMESKAHRRALEAEQTAEAARRTESVLRHRAEAGEATARRAEQRATEQLWHSYLAQARALRRGGQEGQRLESIELVSKAAAIHPSLELRSEAIAALAMTDVRFSDDRESPNPEEVWNAQVELRAVVKEQGCIGIFRVRDNKEVALLPDVGAGVARILGFSPGSRFLAVNYVGDRTVVWDIEKLRPLINNIPGGISADFSPDGQTIAVICQDGQLRQFGLAPVRSLPELALGRRYWALRLCPQRAWFAVYESQKTDLQVRDLRDGSLLKTFSHPSPVGSFAWSSDGKRLAVGCENGFIFIWNALTGEKENELQAHQDSVVSVGFSHSGKLLGSGSWEGQFQLRDLPSGQLVLTAMGNSFQVLFSNGDDRVGYVRRGSKTGSLEIIPSSIFHRLSCKVSALRGAWGIDISADGRLLAAACTEGVFIWTPQLTGEPFFLPAGPCYSAIFSPDISNLITCGPSGLALWPIHRVSGGTIDELRLGPREAIRDGVEFNYAAVSPNGRWLAAANPTDGGVSIYDVDDPTTVFPLLSQPRIQSVAISADGRWIAAGNWKGSSAKVWEFDSKRIVCDVPIGPTAQVLFSPDNRWLAVGAASYEVWETGVWKREYAIRRARPEVTRALAFSPDGRTLAIQDEPGIVQLLAADTGAVLANLEGPGGSFISYLRFSPDGSKLYGLEWDRQIQVWELRHLRSELAKLDLDWNAPAMPTETAGQAPGANRLVRVSMVETPAQ